MRALLLAAAASLTAIILPVWPAQALDPSGFTANGGGSVRVHRGDTRFMSGGAGRFQGCDFRDGRGRDFRDGDGDDGDRRRGRRNVDCNISVGTWTEGGEWALYNNRTWESDSYNDWWHDQPWRSYPKWVSTNQNCERVWWSGGGWRC